MSPKKQAEQLSSSRQNSTSPRIPKLPDTNTILYNEEVRPGGQTPRRELKPSSDEMHPHYYRSQNLDEHCSPGISKLRLGWFLETDYHAKNNNETPAAACPELPGMYPSTPTHSSADASLT